ncbi:hypothetical protein Nmel_000966, partial [Mimus melanotis]
MAETAAVISRGEEEIQNSSDDEDRFLTHDAGSACPGCSASPSPASLNEDDGSSAIPERLSVLSGRALAQLQALTGPGMVSGGQAQRTAPGLAEHPLAVVEALLGSSSCPAAADSLLASVLAQRPCCDGQLCPEVLQAPRAPSVAREARQAGAGTQQAGSDTQGSRASCSVGRVIWMKTTTVLETLESKKKEEKEKYRLQLAMYRRLLLLRSIRSL